MNRQKILGDLKKIRKTLNERPERVIFLTMNEDGTYTEKHIPENQLDSWIEKRQPCIVFLDDVPLDDED